MMLLNRNRVSVLMGNMKKKMKNTTHLQIFSIKIFHLFYYGISDLHFL